jgi:hypothetical protein
MGKCDERLAKHLEELAADSKFGHMNFDILVSQTQQYLIQEQEPTRDPNKSFYALVKEYIQHKNLEFNSGNIGMIKLPELLDYAKKVGQ